MSFHSKRPHTITNMSNNIDMDILCFMKVLPNLTNKKKHRVEELQRKLAENENTRMQQMSTEISSTNILKHLDIKVRENTRMQQMSTEISSTNILKHLDIKVRENTSSYLETPLSLFHWHLTLLLILSWNMAISYW